MLNSDQFLISIISNSLAKMSTFNLIQITILLTIVFHISGKWNKPIELFQNNDSVTSVIGLYIEPTTQVHHVVFHNWGIDRVIYKKLNLQGTVLESHNFSHPEMSYANMGSLVSSNNGKKLHLLLNGLKKNDKNKFGLWYSESTDEGHSWSNVVNVIDMNDNLSRQGSSMVVIQETGRVFVFFTVVEEVAPLDNRGIIKVVSKPPDSSIFSKEVVIYEVPQGLEVRNALTAQYTVKNSKPLLHLLWAQGFSQPDAMYYSSSQDYGISWTTPRKISDNDKIYPYNMIESASNKDFGSMFVGLYTEYSYYKKRVAISNDHGNSFTLLDASSGDHQMFDQWSHNMGIGLCGPPNQPTIYMLIDRNQSPMEYSSLDVKTMRITKLDRPFSEYGDDSCGITLACSSDLAKKEVTISAITEVGYGKPTRYLLMTTEVRKFN